jgi:hypothetical protein
VRGSADVVMHDETLDYRIEQFEHRLPRYWGTSCARRRTPS